MAKAGTMSSGDPAVVRWVNGAFSVFDRMRSRPAFQATREEVIRRAIKDSGLEDFECSEFGEPLRNWCEQLLEPGMAALVRYHLRLRITSCATNRLRLEKQLRDRPRIREERIERPWIVLGLPRSGTTLLHRLLAQDPRHRSPLCWETLLPLPRNARDTAERRAGQVKMFLKAGRFMAPRTNEIHEVGAELPEECTVLLENCFILSAWGHDTPEFRSRLTSYDPVRPFRLHKSLLQYLQHDSSSGGKTWVLKSFQHLVHLDSVLAVYPDAHLIQIHRDPVKALPSWASLAAYSGLHERDNLELHAFGQNIYEDAKRRYYPAFVRKQDRASRLGPDARIVDIGYSDLVRQPLETIAGIYAAFGRTFDADVERRMKAYLDQNPQHKHGKHKYSLEQFGLDESVIRRELSPYMEGFPT